MFRNFNLAFTWLDNLMGESLSDLKLRKSNVIDNIFKCIHVEWEMPESCFCM